MGNHLAIDDSTHAISDLVIVPVILLRLCLLLLCLFWLYLLHPDVTNLHLTAMIALTIPALALIAFSKLSSVYIAFLWIKGWREMLLLLQRVGNGINRLEAALLGLDVKFLLYFRLQGDADTLVTVEHVFGDSVLEVSADNMVENIETFL